MKVIAISGRAASGKDSIALLLKEKLEGVEIFSFSSELKIIASKLWNIPDGDWDDYDKKAKFREKLIALGDAVRQVDKDAWVNIVINKIKEKKPKIAVITDLRFRNELVKLIFEYLYDLYLIRVCAGFDVRMKRMGSERAREFIIKKFENDVSETDLNFMFELYPFGPIEHPHFYDAIDNSSEEMSTLSKWVDKYIKEMKAVEKPYDCINRIIKLTKE